MTAIILSGCASGPSQEAYDALLTENIELQTTIEALQQEPEVEAPEAEEAVTEEVTYFSEARKLLADFAQFEEEISKEVYTAYYANQATELVNRAKGLPNRHKWKDQHNVLEDALFQFQLMLPKVGEYWDVNNIGSLGWHSAIRTYDDLLVKAEQYQ
jgi:hypothetical protein